MAAYYNENDKHAAAWLRELIKRRLIADGVVDERSIEDVAPNDVKGFTQCHFFAGIGGWSYALRLAGWDDKRPVWTGSCPCQPFSEAGAGNGFADQRHLWPHWFHRIKECQPAIVFGEQVASRLAERWLDLVSDDLETMDYAVGAVAFPSASIGAPHIRDRTYWVADSGRTGLQGRLQGRAHQKREVEYGHTGCDSATGGLANASSHRRTGQSKSATAQEGCTPRPDGGRQLPHRPERCTVSTEQQSTLLGDTGTNSHPTDGFWRDADWLFCRDGKWRPVEPSLEPLVNGVSARVVRLRGYGNAINPQQAAVFIMAAMK